MSKKERKTSGEDVANVCRIGWRYGREAANLVHRETALIVAVLSPGHSPVATWRRVPGEGGEQPGP